MISEVSTAEDVLSWLRGISDDQALEDAFKEHSVDGEHLFRMTHEELDNILPPSLVATRSLISAKLDALKRTRCAVKDESEDDSAKSESLDHPAENCATTLPAPGRNSEIDLWKKCRKLSLPKELGLPSNITVISQLSGTENFDTSDDSLSMNKLDPCLKELFDEIGIAELQLQDEETAKFIFDFIEQNGGISRVRQEQNIKKRILLIWQKGRLRKEDSSEEKINSPRME